MNNSIAFAIVALSIIAPSQLCAEPMRPQPVDGNIRWLYSYAEGQRVARADNKPLFVVFRCER